MPAKHFPKNESGDIIHLGRENQITKITVGIRSVGEEPEVTKHPAEIEESDHA